MKEPAVGDVLFNDTRFRDFTKATIERLTKTQAVLSNGDRLRLPLSDYNYVIGETGWFKSCYKPYTEELENRFQKIFYYKEIKKIVDSGMGNYNLQQLRDIYNQITL